MAKERAQSDTVSDGASFQAQTCVPSTLAVSQVCQVTENIV